MRSPSVGDRGFAGIVERPPAKPLIAAVEGTAVAGGFEIVLACDLIVAADNARFGLPEVKRGLVAAGGGLMRLSRRIPFHLAMEWALTGEFVPAETAARFGLVNRLVPAGAAVDEAVALGRGDRRQRSPRRRRHQADPGRGARLVAHRTSSSGSGRSACRCESPTTLARARSRSRRSVLPGGQVAEGHSGSGNTGGRLPRNADAPSIMSALPTACTNIPSPLLNESRAAFHHTFELILAISR